VLGTRVKRSFGTAMKFYDGRRIDHSIAMAVATVAALMLTPPTQTFVDGMTSRNMWSGLRQRMVPQDNNWFGVTGDVIGYAQRRTPAGTPETAAPIATGSIPKADAPAAESSSPKQ